MNHISYSAVAARRPFLARCCCRPFPGGGEVFRKLSPGDAVQRREDPHFKIGWPSRRSTLQKGTAATFAAWSGGDRVFRDVGVHLKGMGSFRPLNEKPSFSVKFDRYTPDQHYLGLTKMMLNNSSQDSTYLAEMMATQMFRDAGLPAARVTHAFVEVNGRALGLYVLIEAMNKEFLGIFQNPKEPLRSLFAGHRPEARRGQRHDEPGRFEEVARGDQNVNPLERWKRLRGSMWMSICLPRGREVYVAHRRLRDEPEQLPPYRSHDRPLLLSPTDSIGVLPTPACRCQPPSSIVTGRAANARGPPFSRARRAAFTNVSTWRCSLIV